MHTQGLTAKDRTGDSGQGTPAGVKPLRPPTPMPSPARSPLGSPRLMKSVGYFHHRHSESVSNTLPFQDCHKWLFLLTEHNFNKNRDTFIGMTAPLLLIVRKAFWSRRKQTAGVETALCKSDINCSLLPTPERAAHFEDCISQLEL